MFGRCGALVDQSVVIWRARISASGAWRLLNVFFTLMPLSFQRRSALRLPAELLREPLVCVSYSL